MSKYVKSIRIETSFEGDAVVASFRPMDYPTATKFQALLEKAPKRVVVKDGKEETVVDPTPEMEQLFREAAAAHLETITGLKDADGAAIAKEEVLTAAYFIPLVSVLATQWSEKSTPQGEA